MIELEEKLTEKIDFSPGLLKKIMTEVWYYHFNLNLVGGPDYKVFLDSGYALGKLSNIQN